MKQKTYAVPATGFTQKRHTLYQHFIGFILNFQIFLNFFFEYNSDTYMDTAKAKLYSSYAIQHQHQY